MLESPLDAIAAALKNRPKLSISDDRLTSVAVLVPLVVLEGEPGIIVTRRTQTVSTHKGEYCFPGGHFEPDDQALTHTALRELHEELGVRPQDVSLLGELDDVQTLNRVKIAPFVGRIPYPYPFAPSPDEVADVVPLRLAQLLAPDVRTVELWQRPSADSQTGRVEDPARPRPLTFYRVDRHVIWGATGRILDLLLLACGLLAPEAIPSRPKNQ